MVNENLLERYHEIEIDYIPYKTRRSLHFYQEKERTPSSRGKRLRKILSHDWKKILSEIFKKKLAVPFSAAFLTLYFTVMFCVLSEAYMNHAQTIFRFMVYVLNLRRPHGYCERWKESFIETVKYLNFTLVKVFLLDGRGSVLPSEAQVVEVNRFNLFLLCRDKAIWYI